MISYGSDPNDKFPACYFRKSIVLSNVAELTELNLSLLRDDGAVVYLNGTEVFRDNLPTGAVAYRTWALAAIGKDQELLFLGGSMAPALLQEGTNVVAVEIHQVDPTSSDLSFDLELSGLEPSAPVMVLEPEDQAVSTGGTAQFSVVAAGAQPLFYQWYLNGLTAVADGTNRTLVIVNAGPPDEGSYSVVVTNHVGLVRSASARLRLVDQPQILVPPQSQTAVIGSRVEFVVVAVGTAPLSYRWWVDGTNLLAGATNQVLVLESVTLDQSGQYSVEVYNAVGRTTSAPASLRVLASAQLTSVSLAGDTIVMTFATSKNLRYTVEFTEALFAPRWTALPNAVKLFGTGGILTVQDVSPPSQQRFYRVRVE